MKTGGRNGALGRAEAEPLPIPGVPPLARTGYPGAAALGFMPEEARGMPGLIGPLEGPVA